MMAPLAALSSGPIVSTGNFANPSAVLKSQISLFNCEPPAMTAWLLLKGNNMGKFAVGAPSEVKAWMLFPASREIRKVCDDSSDGASGCEPAYTTIELESSRYAAL